MRLVQRSSGQDTAEAADAAWRGRRLQLDGIATTVVAQSRAATRLTAHPGLELFAKFSPDATRVAYVREATGPGGRFNQVFVADAPAPPS